MITSSLSRVPTRLLALAALAAATAAAALVSTSEAAAGNGSAPAGTAGAGPISAGLGLSVGALVSLGPISIADGNVTVTGTVDANAAVGGVAAVGSKTKVKATIGGTAAVSATASAKANVSAAANVKLSVNDQPVAIDDHGGFKATVAVGAQPAVRIQAASLVTGEVFVTTIPVAAIPSGGSPVDALATLNAAGLTLLLPADGLTCFDGRPTQLTLNVANASLLAGLTIDGVNVLGTTRGSSSSSSASKTKAKTKTRAKAKTTTKVTWMQIAGGSAQVVSSSDGSLVVRQAVASSSHDVEIAVTDTKGVMQVSTFPVKRLTSVIRIGRASSVTAAGARGLRVSALRFVTAGVTGRHRVRLQVTLRDRRNYLVRDAVVVVRGIAHRTTIAGQFATITNSRGTATFTLPVTSRLLGKRLYVEVYARIPAASVRVRASIGLPGALAA